MELNQDNTLLSILRFGHTLLALPQSQIKHVDTLNLDKQKRDLAQSSGKSKKASYTTYAIDEELRINEKTEHVYQYKIVISDGMSCRLAVLCDDVQILRMSSNSLQQPLPDFMRQSHCPIQHMMQHEERLLLISDAVSLNQWLTTLEQPRAVV